MRTFTSILCAFSLTGAIACGKSEPPKPSIEVASSQGTEPAAAPAASAETPGEMMAAGHAKSAPPAAAPGLVNATGTIIETMDSGGYTYMRLKLEGGGETWAAVDQTKVKKGDTVSIANAMPMDGFESKTLKRRFDRILFGQLGAPAAGVPAGMGHAPMAPQAEAQMAAQHAKIGEAPDMGKVDVPKAEGADGRRIAEVFAQRAQLADKNVSIRGKVVKFTPGVMGRNWIHLHDGSGRPETKDNDITVTTQGAAAVGDVIVVKGKVALGRDFGMGYSYPVLIEEATVTK